MKHSSLAVSLIIFGFIALLFGALYFGAPLFGWLIILAILLIFLGASLRDARALSKLEREASILSQVRENNFELSIEKILEENPKSLVSERKKLLRGIPSGKISFSGDSLLSLLHEKTSLRAGRSASGAVILLGLMGTFFGLMQSIAVAGSALDTASSATLDTIHSIFSNMRGIFGTSLCGIFASLILSLIHSMLEKKLDEFSADLDLFTITNLFPKKEEDKVSSTSSDELSSLLSTWESSMTHFRDSLLESQKGVLNEMEKWGNNILSARENVFGELRKEISQAFDDSLIRMQSLETETLSKFGKTLEESLFHVGKSFDDSFSRMQSLETETLSKFEKTLYLSSNHFAEESKEILETISIAGKNFEIAWKSWLENLMEESTQARNESEKIASNLSEIALRMEQKSMDGVKECSEKISENLNHLSTEIRGTFESLFTASAQLVKTQETFIEELKNRLVKEGEASDALSSNVIEASHLMRVNQSEFSASLEMFTKGLEALLEKLSGETEEKGEAETLVEQIRNSLELFHERAGEILVENALKTQEILLEILEQSQRSAFLANSKKAEA